MSKQNISSNSTFKGILKTISIGSSLSLIVGVGGAIGFTELKENLDRKKSNGIALLEDGAHLKQGNHNFIITDEFYSCLKYEDELDQKLVMDSFKQVYKTFNYLNSSKLKFTLCTTSDEVSEKYNLPKINSFSRYDVPLYISEDDINNQSQTVGSTSYKVDYFSRELYDESITFKKKYLFAVYSLNGTPEEFLVPTNSLAYTVCAHETMHIMGFAHQSKNSILYPYVPSPYKDFTDRDKALLVKYNQTFYNATPAWVNNEEENQSNNHPKQTSLEEAHAFLRDNFNDMCK